MVLKFKPASFCLVYIKETVLCFSCLLKSWNLFIFVYESFSIKLCRISVLESGNVVTLLLLLFFPLFVCVCLFKWMYLCVDSMLALFTEVLILSYWCNKVDSMLDKCCWYYYYYSYYCFCCIFDFILILCLWNLSMKFSNRLFYLCVCVWGICKCFVFMYLCVFNVGISFIMASSL